MIAKGVTFALHILSTFCGDDRKVLVLIDAGSLKVSVASWHHFTFNKKESCHICIVFSFLKHFCKKGLLKKF